MNKRQYKKMIKKYTIELHKIFEEFERGLICGLEKAIKKVEDNND